MQPTPEQADAIHIHDKNLIVVAGAGSGKTRVLVERYVQLLENNPAWKLSALVAITFTRAAAYEMRHRVRLEIENRAAAASDSHSAALWSQRLIEMESARIDTIHGLCVGILRANAAQAGIDPQFEVLDDTEAAILREEAVSDALQNLDPPLKSLFAAYDARKIIDALKEPAHLNAAASLEALPPPVLFQRWQQARGRPVNPITRAAAALKLWQQVQSALLNSDEARRLRGNADDFPAGDALSALGWQYAACLERIAAASDAASLRRCLTEGGALGSPGNKGRANAWGGKAAKQRTADDLRTLRSDMQDMLLDWQTAELLPLWVGILQAVQRGYRERKQAAARLDFDDLERLTAELLQDKAVQARYRQAEWRHLLVDEFQDTNQAQWQIIQALADLQRGGTFFAVGDPKQSIYQFRGADVSVFNRVRRRIAESTAGQELNIATSFRSHPRLIAQFNRLFERILTPSGSDSIAPYEVTLDQPMRAFRRSVPSQAAIELLLLSNSDRPIEERRRWEAWEIARAIQSRIGRLPIFERGSWRAAEHRDFAILFQSMAQVTLYEEVFKAQGLPFMTVAGRGYYDRQEVRDMLALLRCLHSPADSLSLATILRSPLFGFSDDLLFALRLPAPAELDQPPTLWGALQSAAHSPPASIAAPDEPCLQFAADTLHRLRQMAGRISISELLRQALAMTGYLAILTALPDGARRRGNIEKLLELAEKSGKITLGKFSQYLADLTAREIREGEALLEAGQAVRLMTVHASKGLEFPFVILADASWQHRSASDTLLYDPEIGLSCQIFDEGKNGYVSGSAHQSSRDKQRLKNAAERKRLLYVAATRAQDYLLISGQVKQNRQGEWTANGWLDALLSAFELRTLPAHIQQNVGFGGDIAVHMPAEPPAALYQHHAPSATQPAFEEQAAAFPAPVPPLIAPVPAQKTRQIRHITATQLADLSALQQARDANERRFYQQRFRQAALHDMPARLRTRRRQNPARWVGRMVHEVLRHWKLDLPADDLRALLDAYAWQQGCTQSDQRDALIEQAQTLLNTFRRSDLCRQISAARSENRPLFSELPFSWRTQHRVLHGVMDLLFQQTSGDWVVVDYKTDRITQNFEQQARRYHLQVGVYAAAVQAQFGSKNPPQTWIHYLHSARTVKIPPADWQAQLARLEDQMASLEEPDA